LEGESVIDVKAKEQRKKDVLYLHRRQARNSINCNLKEWTTPLSMKEKKSKSKEKKRSLTQR